MNDANLSGNKTFPIAEVQSQLLRWLKEQINIAPGEDISLHELSQIFQIIDYQLGDLISSRADLLDSQNQENLDSQSLFIVCEGKVRLLSLEVAQGQQVSVGLLREGETFGGDSYYCQASLTYQAIAASKVTIAQVPFSEIQPWLERFPQLTENWGKEARNRQRLVFFKSLGKLVNIPTHKLQDFCGYLEETTIASGEYLAQEHSEAGRFWLRQGKIQNQTSEPGLVWGYPEPIPGDWVAQTELLTYYLPRANWEAAIAIAPSLGNTESGSSQLQPIRKPYGSNQVTSSALFPPPTSSRSHSVVKSESAYPSID